MLAALFPLDTHPEQRPRSTSKLSEPYSVIRLDEVEAVPTFGKLKWKPLRRPLDVRAFGEHPDNPSLLYQLACVEALAGESEPAIDHLRRALELKPSLAKDAGSDEDFASIRGLPGFPA